MRVRYHSDTWYHLIFEVRGACVGSHAPPSVLVFGKGLFRCLSCAQCGALSAAVHTTRIVLVWAFLFACTLLQGAQFFFKSICPKSFESFRLLKMHVL